MNHHQVAWSLAVVIGAVAAIIIFRTANRAMMGSKPVIISLHRNKKDPRGREVSFGDPREIRLESDQAGAANLGKGFAPIYGHIITQMVYPCIYERSAAIGF